MKRFKNLRSRIHEYEEKVEEQTEKIKLNEVNKKSINNNKLLINITVFISILVMSFGILLYYPKIKEISNSQNNTPYDDCNLLQNISNCSFVLYKDIVEKTSGSEKSIESIYIDSYTDDYNYDNDNDFTEVNGEKKRTRYVNTVLNPLQSHVYSMQSKLNFNLRNLEYAALDKDGNVIVNRG
ncbi:MAG: sensor histidine kinase, partial [Clostridium sp.]